MQLSLLRLPATSVWYQSLTFWRQSLPPSLGTYLKGNVTVRCMYTHIVGSRSSVSKTLGTSSILTQLTVHEHCPVSWGNPMVSVRHQKVIYDAELEEVITH